MSALEAVYICLYFFVAPLVALVFTVEKFPEPLNIFAKSDGLGGRDYGGDPAQDLILSTQRIPRGWDPILSTQRISRGGDRILYTQRIVDNAYIEGRCDRKSPFSR